MQRRGRDARPAFVAPAVAGVVESLAGCNAAARAALTTRSRSWWAGVCTRMCEGLHVGGQVEDRTRDLALKAKECADLRQVAAGARRLWRGPQG